MTPTDRDALIEQMRGELELVMTDTENPGRYCHVSPAELAALISLASPSPAWPEDVVRIVPDAANPNNLRMWVKGAQWCKVYGFDPTEAAVRAFTLRAALATLPPPEDEERGPKTLDEPRLRDVLKFLCDAHEGLMFDLRHVLEFGPNYNQAVKDGMARIGASCDTISDILISRPPEDERVKGLVEAATNFQRAVGMGWNLASANIALNEALASYGGE